MSWFTHIFYLSIVIFLIQISQCEDTGSILCPCIESVGFSASDQCDDNFMNIEYFEDEYDLICYPLSYGINCNSHDIDMKPHCVLPNGDLNPSAPSWCYDQWCYVDENNCDAAYTYSESSLFDDEEPIFYSYATCGYMNAWLAFLEDPNLSVQSLQGVVENYVKEISIDLERHFQALNSDEMAGVTCVGKESCDCENCATKEGWGPLDENNGYHEYCTESAPSNQKCTDILLDFNDLTITRRESNQHEIDCIFSSYKRTVLQIVSKEHDDPTRLGYIYMGHQETGDFIQWPGIQWCTEDYDPRFRPWYAASASGPKDIVLVIDISGSMAISNRYEVAKQAAIKVIDTLIFSDWASVVLFDSSLVIYNDVLIQMTDENKQLMKEWIELNVIYREGTNFFIGLEKAFEILKESKLQMKSSLCKGAVLFLTDGDADWNDAKSEAIMSANNDDWDISIFTYAIGDGANHDVTKRIACENKGIFYAVPDGANLNTIMAGYYEYFATAQTTEQSNDEVRWSIYNDWITNEELFAGCLPIFDREKSPADLIGVHCMDINTIVPLEQMKLHTGYDEFENDIREQTKKCTPISLSYENMESLRGKYSQNSKCSSAIVVTTTLSPDVETQGNESPIVFLIVFACGLLIFSIVLYFCCCKPCCCKTQAVAVIVPNPPLENPAQIAQQNVAASAPDYNSAPSYGAQPYQPSFNKEQISHNQEPLSYNQQHSPQRDMPPQNPKIQFV